MDAQHKASWLDTNINVQSLFFALIAAAGGA